jgi:hypothetical protein
MKNKDIQFYFNRPDRPVNSGRITGIRKEAYANSKEICPASETAVAEFIRKHSAGGGAIVFPASTNSTSKGPLSVEALKDLFEEVGVGIQWRLRVGETDQHECKATFGLKHTHHWLKPMAALANNRGGYILLGVHDKGKVGPDGEDLSHVVCGISDEFGKLDPVELTKKVKAIFDPTPRFKMLTISVGGKSVGIIYVEPHPSRPVIATKTEGEIREGDIYFRYSGQTARIKYSDFRAMLDERDASARARMLPMIERLLTLGPSKAMVADLNAGTLVDGKNAIHIDEALVDRLTFIKEGQFSERDGAPTLRLLGAVSPVATVSPSVKKGAITRADVLRDFLTQDLSLDPKETIRFVLESTSGDWLPLRYFAKQAGLTKAQLIALIKSTNAPTARVLLFVSRVNNKDAAYKKLGGKAAALLAEIESKQQIPDAVSSKEAGHVASAMLGLSRQTKVPLAILRKSLTSLCRTAVGSRASIVRRALCRVDEIYFAL